MKFPVFHWQEPQPLMGKFPPVRRPHMGTPSLGRKCIPEEEFSWPLGPLSLCHVSTSMALRTSAVFSLFGAHSSEVIRPLSLFTPLNISEKERDNPPFIPLLLSCKFNKQNLDKRLGLLAKTRLRVCSETVGYCLEQRCSVELSAVMEVLCVCAFQHTSY